MGEQKARRRNRYPYHEDVKRSTCDPWDDRNRTQLSMGSRPRDTQQPRGQRQQNKRAIPRAHYKEAPWCFSRRIDLASNRHGQKCQNQEISHFSQRRGLNHHWKTRCLSFGCAEHRLTWRDLPNGTERRNNAETNPKQRTGLTRRVNGFIERRHHHDEDSKSHSAREHTRSKKTAERWQEVELNRTRAILLGAKGLNKC